jgi:hypothetical protein
MRRAQLRDSRIPAPSTAIPTISTVIKTHTHRLPFAGGAAGTGTLPGKPDAVGAEDRGRMIVGSDDDTGVRGWNTTGRDAGAASDSASGPATFG